MSEPRILPAADPRVETGTVQFGDDWPGLFIRGDCAFAFALCLRHALGELREEFNPYYRIQLEGLLEELQATRVKPRGV